MVLLDLLFEIFSGSWYEIDRARCYFYDNGVMRTGRCKAAYTYSSGYVEITWYYANENVALQSGWQTIGGKEYYFDPSGLYLYSDGWYETDGKYYIFATRGKCLGEA